MAGFLQEHVLTRTVRDCAAVLDGTCGPEPGDPYCAPPVRERFAAAADRAPGPLRIAVTTCGPAGEPSHPDCVEAVASTTRVLEELGHQVEAAIPPAWAVICEQAMVIAAAQIAHEIDAHAAHSGRAPTPDLLEPRTWSLYEAGRRLGAAAYIAALAAVHAAARPIAGFMQRYDVWLTPALPAPPPRLEEPLEASGEPEGDFSAIAFAVLANATGQPSISLPLGLSSDGLPVGVMFTGRFGDEAGLISLAAQLEAAMPWRGRRPPIWG
jgi:amidase